MDDSTFPNESQSASPRRSVCPACGSRMEGKVMRQLFSVWTAGEAAGDDSYQTEERAICILRCSVCGYEEYELPEG